MKKSIKINSLLELYELLPEEERIMVDILRHIIQDVSAGYCKEKISYNVPYFYARKGICIIWPAAIPRGGFNQGVLLGFWQGNKLQDPNQYLDRGSNKKIFYKIYKSVDEIDEEQIILLLKEAIELDKSFV